MSSILKVLKKIDASDTKALQIEVPAEILKDLNIQADGTVDLEVLMQICQRLARVKKLKNKVELAQKNTSEELVDLIFNPDRVAEADIDQRCPQHQK